MGPGMVKNSERIFYHPRFFEKRLRGSGRSEKKQKAFFCKEDIDKCGDAVYNVLEDL